MYIRSDRKLSHNSMSCFNYLPVTVFLQLLGAGEITGIDGDLSHLCIYSGLLSSLKGQQFELIHATRNKTVISSILDAALHVNKRQVTFFLIDRL